VDQPEGAAIAPSTSETDLNGRASVEVTLGRPAGDQPVDARLADPDHELRVRFLLTAIRSNTGGVDNGGNGGGGGSGAVTRRTVGEGRARGKGRAIAVMAGTTTTMVGETRTSEIPAPSGADRIVRDQSPRTS
jgi:hypothetical protein